MDGNLTLDELYAAANEMCRKWWGVEYTGEIELVNRKWRTQRACYQYKKAGEPVQIIRMSRPTNAQRTRDAVLGSLLHELVHWRLHTTGKPAHDTAREFVIECIRVGAPFSEAENAQAAARKYVDALPA